MWQIIALHKSSNGLIRSADVEEKSEASKKRQARKAAQMAQKKVSE